MKDELEALAKSAALRHAETSETFRRLIRMALAMTVYIDCKDSRQRLQPPKDKASHFDRLAQQAQETNNQGKRRKLQARVTRLVIDPMVWVGEGLAQDARGDSDTRSVTPHWRRGHTRQVWVGSKRDEQGQPRKGERTVRRFIPPCLVKGRTLSAADKQVLDLGHQYSVEVAPEPDEGLNNV